MKSEHLHVDVPMPTFAYDASFGPADPAKKIPLVNIGGVAIGSNHPGHYMKHHADVDRRKGFTISITFKPVSGKNGHIAGSSFLGWELEHYLHHHYYDYVEKALHAKGVASHGRSKPALSPAKKAKLLKEFEAERKLFKENFLEDKMDCRDWAVFLWGGGKSVVAQYGYQLVVPDARMKHHKLHETTKIYGGAQIESAGPWGGNDNARNTEETRMEVGRWANIVLKYAKCESDPCTDQDKQNFHMFVNGVEVENALVTDDDDATAIDEDGTQIVPTNPAVVDDPYDGKDLCGAKLHDLQMKLLGKHSGFFDKFKHLLAEAEGKRVEKQRMKRKHAAQDGGGEVASTPPEFPFYFGPTKIGHGGGARVKISPVDKHGHQQVTGWKNLNGSFDGKVSDVWVWSSKI